MNKAPTSLVIGQATSFDDYVRQLMIPTRVLELTRMASAIRLSTWEAEVIRASIAPGGGLLREILKKKAEADGSHPPYIRVACTGRGDYDEMAAERYGYGAAGEVVHKGSSARPLCSRSGRRGTTRPCIRTATPRASSTARRGR